MREETSRRYRGSNRLPSLFFMAVVSVSLVLLTGAWYQGARVDYMMPMQDVFVPVAGARALTVTEQEERSFGIDSAAQALDADGQAVGFVIVSSTRGYRSDIRVQSIFAADGETLAGIQVLAQDETEYLGTRIQTEGFTSLFNGRRAPMKLWGSATFGSPIDALSGSTVSSQAVVDAVNHAYEFLQNRVA